MYIVEHDEIRNNKRIVVVFTDMGHRCGYVGVNGDHCLNGLGYNSPVPENLKFKVDEVLNGPVGKRGFIDILCNIGGEQQVGFLFDVHGSITYSGKEENYPVHNEDGMWYFFGFDCMHCDDGRDFGSMLKYGFKIHGGRWLLGIARSKKYVLDECYRLAEQFDNLGY
jgi:hypothetical protein